MMNYQDLETRYIISQGLKNIHNPFLYYMIEKNDFSIQKKGGINYNAIAWYVTPFINAVVRSGDEDEKKLIFRSMLTYEAFKKIPSGKRGQKGELIPRVEEAVRIAANVKARQTKLQDGSMSLIEKKIAREHLLDEPILLLKCDAGEVEKNLAGLLANRLQAKYQRPTFVLIKGKSKEEPEYFYRGSARNYSKSEIQNLRELCEGIDSVEYAQGHEAAFGISIKEKNIDTFLEEMENTYNNIPHEAVYYVDYIFNQKDSAADKIQTLSNMSEYWGQEIPETNIAVKDVILSNAKVMLLSPDKNPTIKITLENGVVLIKFGSSAVEFEEFMKPNQILTVVGTPNINEWNGVQTPQILINDYELREEWIF